MRDVMPGVCIASVLALACNGNAGAGSDESVQPPTAAEIAHACGAVDACEGAEGRQECETTFDLFSLSRPCVEAIIAASCEEHRLVWARTCSTLPGGCSCVPADATGGTLPEGVSVRQADAADSDSACAAIEACGGTCASEFKSGLLTEACTSAIEAAACEEHGQEAPGYHDTCFPRCEQEASYCSEDHHHVTRCGDLGGALRWSTRSCERLCAAHGFEWTGVCELNGQCDCVPGTSSEP